MNSNPSASATPATTLVSSAAVKLNRPLDELVKESKKVHQKQHRKNKSSRNINKKPQQQNNKSQVKGSSGIKPDQVRVTIKNENALKRVRVPSPRISQRMEGVSFSRDSDSRIDYGRPVSVNTSRYNPPASRQPRIRKP